MEETRTTARRPGPTAEEIIDWGNRYLAGATAPMLARMSGRTTGSIEHHLKSNGFLKKLHPDAVFCWRGTAAFEASRACADQAAAEAGPEPERRAAYRVKGETVWALVREAYLSGWSARRVAAHYGVTVAALRKRAARQGWRKCDRPDEAEPMPAPWGANACGSPSTAYGGPPPPQAGEDQEPLVLHDHQRPPTRTQDGGDWATWLVLGGRGAGKTLAGASWVAEQAARLGAGGRIALVGATIHDVREVMIGGPSGLMNLGRWGEARPVYSPTRRRVQFPGGCEGWVFSAEEPDRLRGPQFHCAWADEYCAWKPGAGVQDALAMLRLGLRLGARPQLVITTTPRPTRALKRLMAEPGVAVTRAGTGANAAHLAPGFVAGLTALYGGTRLAAQEIDGQVVDDGLALFSAEMMSGCRGEGPGEGLERVVVGVDPCVTAGGHACGIVVVGRAGTRAYVLADRTVKGVSPEAWARAAVAAARDHGAAGLVVEVNQGGELVSGLLRAIGEGITVKPVRASVGKRARAEPVAALYEQGRVVHAGAGLEALEEELMGIGEEAGDLDRADALVWAVTDLMLGEPAAMPRVSAAGPEPRIWGLAPESETDLSAPGPWPRLR